MVDAVTLAAPQLITYVDRLGDSIAGTTELLRGPLRQAFGGVHLLPFFRPYDGADAGFDPDEHTEVDARLGGWPDIRELAGSHLVMADVIANHVSSRSPQFRDVLDRGAQSPWHSMFLSLGSIFPDGATEADLAAIYRPRPGLPFTPMVVGGRRRLMWTTFTPEQIDLDIRDPQTWRYLTGVVDRLTSAGVRMIRLDAVGYVGKVAGTDCFMTDAAATFLQRLRHYAAERGASTLVEVHGHHRQQLAIARTVDWVYDFALPPLALHAVLMRDPAPLAHWLGIRPANSVSVLDTHDGIGVVDVAAGTAGPGLLTDAQLDTLVEAIHVNTRGASRRATGAAASNLDLYQVNSTCYDAFGRDDRGYLLARLIQLLLPGIPQVYYVGLLAGHNDLELLGRTGVGRDVNRHHYTRDEIDAALERDVVRAQLSACRMRAAHPAFRGHFRHTLHGKNLRLRWDNDGDSVALCIDFTDLEHRLTSVRDGARTVVEDVRELADRFADQSS